MQTLGRWIRHGIMSSIIAAVVAGIALAVAYSVPLPASIGAGLLALGFAGGPFVWIFAFIGLELRYDARHRRAQLGQQSEED